LVVSEAFEENATERGEGIRVAMRSSKEKGIRARSQGRTVACFA
jgi:hypothetical protein